MNYTPSREDYLISVFLLTKNHPPVRLSDVANSLAVTKPSAFAALHLLADNGLLAISHDKTLTLTTDGLRQAHLINSRYQTVLHLLTDILLVPAPTAQDDAHAIEHLISDETQAKLQTYLTAHAKKTSP